MSKGTARADWSLSRRPFTSAAFQFAAIDSPPEQPAAGRADDRADRAITPAIEFAPDERTDGGANDQSGRAILAAAVVAAILAPPNAIIVRNAARLVIAPISVIEATILGALAVRRRPGRRIRQRRAGGNGERSEDRSGDIFLHDPSPSIRHRT